MRIRGVLLGTVEEQVAGGDQEPMAFPEGWAQEGVPVTDNFDHSKLIGRARAFVENGRLMAEVELAPGAEPSALPSRFAFGGTAGLLYSLGLTDKNVNGNQPPWEVVSED